MVSEDMNSGLRLRGRIDTQVHSTETLRQAVDDYDTLTKSEKLKLTRTIQPETEDTAYNVTTDNLHRYFVDNLDPSNTSSRANVDLAWLALGTDAGEGTSPSDTDLNNRVFSSQVTDVADNGKQIIASTFLASTDGNGNSFDEVGLFSGNPANKNSDDVFLINHATLSDVQKDNTKTLTFDVTLSFSNV